MAIKSFRPTTPTFRFKTVVDYSVLTPKSKLPSRPRKLTEPLHRRAGRNNHGRITMYHQAGGHGRKYRVIDFKRDKLGVPGKVASLEYDPNRSTFISLVNYADGEKRFILAPINLSIGDQVLASDQADIKPGNNLSMGMIPPGTLIHNLEIEPGRGGKLVRSAGQFAQLMAKDGDYCQVKLPSGEIRRFHRLCRASIGQLSNTDHENVKIGKAGRQRWLGIKPTVRGVAMNPVDHPMGGGEGKASGGHPRSRWGTYSKGYKTRRNKRSSTFIVKRRK